MNQENHAYRYVATDDRSYDLMAEYAADMREATAALFPQCRTLVISFENEKEREGMSLLINAEALNLHIIPVKPDMDEALGGSIPQDPVTLWNLLRSAKEQNNALKKELGEMRDFKEFWQHQVNVSERYRAALNTISALADAIVK